jgi:hypothetical protein
MDNDSAHGKSLTSGNVLVARSPRMRAETVAPLVEVERRVKRLDRMERAKGGAMYAWAARTLAELRAERATSGP